PDADESLRLAIGERPEHDAVDDAEDRGRGADPERDDRDGGDPEARCLAEEAGADAEVPADLAKARPRPLLAGALLRGVDAPEAEARHAARRLRRHPARDVGLRLALHVKAHLLGEVGVDVRAPEQRPGERDELMTDSH